jgi:hypothetical protein
MHAVDFLLDMIVASFITEFVVDTTNSYTVAEHDFLKGPKGRYFRSLHTSIKTLWYDNGVITMESDK